MKLSQLQSKYKQVVTTIQEMKLINSQKDGQITERNEHIQILQEENADFKDQVIFNKQLTLDNSIHSQADLTKNQSYFRRLG